ncbi:MAG: (4Fe-4S)-binding protein [Rikenellaceae bacterium]|nr:(4Fe-4S)-binding protein [Rikenellaceae bacterium]
MSSPLYQCSNEEIIIFWDQSKCVNSGMCHYNLRSVFDPTTRPWIKINGASKEEIIAAIEKCPTGALAYKIKITEEAFYNEFTFG